MFGAKEPASSHAGASAEITADLSGMERLSIRATCPPSYAGRVGDTMELPSSATTCAFNPNRFSLNLTSWRFAAGKRAQRKLEQEMAKRERELQKQGAVPASSSASDAVEAANAARRLGEIAAGSWIGCEDAFRIRMLASQMPSRRKTLPGEKSFRKPLAAGIAVVAVMFCAAVAIATYQMELWGGKTVPAVDGLSVADATSVLEEKGFAVEVVDEKSDGTEGVVLSSDPARHRARRGLDGRRERLRRARRPRDPRRNRSSTRARPSRRKVSRTSSTSSSSPTKPRARCFRCRPSRVRG